MGAEHGTVPTQLDGTIQLPDGRRLPVTVTVDWSELQKVDVPVPDTLLLRAVEVFGRADKALSWLHTPHPLFQNQTPQALAQTEEGREQVLGVLFD
ncbi:MAG: DUF2384 domain-containing protein, partial [Acidobacteriaceae bacterium]|nr:DUF2384 domain-containing protein [Acidobacteriaceae bacterium]